MRRRSGSAVAALAVVLAACSGDDGGSDATGPGDGENGGTTPTPASVLVAPQTVMIWDRGAIVQLEAVVLGADDSVLTGVSPTWSTSDSSVASVSQDGLVTGRGDGWAVIRATAGSAQGGTNAIVVPPDADPGRTDCIACHADDYVGRHGGTATPETCLLCHRGQTWAGASVDHELVSGGFRLLGAHATLACTACHAPDGTPLYPGVTDDECIACHAADYESQHAGSGYPTDCLICHDASAWTNATFDHDAEYFPIYSGAHWNKWGSCSTCHVDPVDFGVFSCFNCHGERSMEQRHTGVSGYRYDSGACYACHPTGEA